MAQPPATTNGVADNVQTRSHGRGGAGNISSKPGTPLNTADLQTPTIKGQNYTTGRGGAGNIKPNGDPIDARLAQDVDAPAAHVKDMSGTYHWGRGGEGNMTTIGKSSAAEDARAKSKERKKSKERTLSKSGERRPSFQGVVNKGKEILGIKKEGQRNGSGLACEEKSESAIV